MEIKKKKKQKKKDTEMNNIIFESIEKIVEEKQNSENIIGQQTNNKINNVLEDMCIYGKIFKKIK